jgi:hypothetical protein
MEKTMNAKTMAAEQETLTAGKIFGHVTKEAGFRGRGATRYYEYPTYYLLINKKPSQRKRFHINIAMVYKELSRKTFSGEELQNAFKDPSPVPRHVDAKIEHFMPESKKGLQEIMDACVDDERMDDLKEVIRDALRKVIAFVEKNNDRKTIRKLHNEKKFPARIHKSV